MPVIYCAVDMFAVGQAGRVTDGNTTTTIYCNASDLASTVATLCREKDITNVHFYGNEDYLQSIVDSTKMKYNSLYNCGRPLNIEVN